MFFFFSVRVFVLVSFVATLGVRFRRDYVDRGKQSLETICLLLAYKIKYPENFFVLRGNHECASINRIYGFYDECQSPRFARCGMGGVAEGQKWSGGLPVQRQQNESRPIDAALI